MSDLMVTPVADRHLFSLHEEEEVTEVLQAVKEQNAREVHAELGDLLLAVVNLSRKLGVDAENALLDATQRFKDRFEIVEDKPARES